MIQHGGELDGSAIPHRSATASLPHHGPRNRDPSRIPHRLARALSDLLFPPRCAICRRGILSADEHICGECGVVADRVRFAPACPRCAGAIGPHELVDGRCAWCRATRIRVHSTVRVGAYEGWLRKLVWAYKFRGREELEPILAEWLAHAVIAARWFDEIDAVVAVPTHWRHRIVRRCYPAETLARSVARLTGLPSAPVLRRLRAGRHQVGLSYEERIKNVRGAFAIRSGVRLDRPSLLLIDDVTTTGATIEECARVLLDAGAAAVFAGTIANAGWRPGHAHLLESI